MIEHEFATTGMRQELLFVWRLSINTEKMNPQCNCECRERMFR